jgi:putative addiction module CopG family antidote
MNISLTTELEKFITDRVQSGMYHSASQVVREALRLLQEEYMLKEIKLAELKREIQKSRESGSSKELDIEDVVSRGKKRLASKRTTCLWALLRLSDRRYNSGMIESNPNILSGKPVVAGTRITVELILDKLGAGESIEQLLEAHPRLTRQDVLSAISFASETLRADVVYPLSGSVA